MTSTITHVAGDLVSLAVIDATTNVRDLDQAHVEALASSIAVRGLITPLTVAPAGDGRYSLIAGFHRYAACATLGLETVAVVVRDGALASADQGAENILRKNLTPLEEALAVAQMLRDGLTVDGAAAALGWSRARVTARQKILELPEGTQQLIATGKVAISSVEMLLTIHRTAPKLGAAVAQVIEAGDVDGQRLQTDPGWVIGQASRTHQVFAAYVDAIGAGEIADLKLGSKTDRLYARAEELHRKTDPYAYGPPRISFAEAELDQARAVGGLLELDDARSPIIIDRHVYGEITHQAITRTVSELEQRVLEQREEARESAGGQGGGERTPREQLDTEHRARLRDLARRAANVNLELGASLIDTLAVVDPDSVDVARFFAYGLLGPDTGYGLERTARALAVSGLRLVVDGQRTETTAVLKSGKPGKTKITYSDPEDAEAWMWKWIDAAKTAGELLGRALTVYAAQHYALQIAVPASQRRHSQIPRSHGDRAQKALTKLAKTALPGSYTQLKRAIDREAKQYHANQAKLAQS